MLGGGRQRRMVSLGKVTAPKPVNLPSQRKENNGNDPSVSLVSKPGAGWSEPPGGAGTPGSSAPTGDGDTPKLPPRVIPAQPAPAWGGAGLPNERRRALELASREQFPTLDAAAAAGPDDPRRRPSSRSRSPHAAWDDDDRGPYAPPPYGGDRRYGPGPDRGYGGDDHHHHGRERYGRGPYDRGYDRGGPYDREEPRGGGYYEQRERYGPPPPRDFRDGPPPPRDFRDEPPPFDRERGEDHYGGGPRRGPGGPYGGGPGGDGRDFSPEFHGPPRGGPGGPYRGRDRGGDFYPPRRGRAEHFDGPPPQPGRRGEGRDPRDGPPLASPRGPDGEFLPGGGRRRDSGIYRRGGPGTPPHPRGAREYDLDESHGPIVPPPPPPPPPPRRKDGGGPTPSAASAAGLDRSASGMSGADSETASRRATAGSSLAPSLARSEMGSVASMLTGEEGGGAGGEPPRGGGPSYAHAANGGEAESAPPPGYRGATPTRILKRPEPQGLVPPGGMAPVGAAAAQLPPSAGLRGLTLDAAPAEVSFMDPLAAPPAVQGGGAAGLGGAAIPRSSMPPALQGLSLQLGSAFSDAPGLFAAPGAQQPLASFGPGAAGGGGLGGLSLGLTQVPAAAATLSGPPPLQFGDILLPSAIDGSVEPDSATPPNAGGRSLLGDLGAQFGGAGDKAGGASGARLAEQQRRDGKKQRGGRGRGGRGAPADSGGRPTATVLLVPPPPPPPPPAGGAPSSQGDAKNKTRRGGRRRKGEGAAGGAAAPEGTSPGGGDGQQGEGRGKRRGGAPAGGAPAGAKAGGDRPAAPPGLQLPAEGGAGGDDGDGGKSGRKTRGGRGKRRGRGGGEGGEGGAPSEGGAPKADAAKTARSRGGGGGGGGAKGPGGAAPPPPPPPPRPPAAP